MAARLPSMIAFPKAAWRNRLVPGQWEACVDAWVFLAEVHLSLSPAEFIEVSSRDESLLVFLSSLVLELASSNEIATSSGLTRLRKQSLLLSHRLLGMNSPPKLLLKWEFLAAVSKICSKNHAHQLLALAWEKGSPSLEISLTAAKNSLTKELDAGLKGNLKVAEAQLKRINHLLNASPQAAAFFMAGSDLLDAVISCYKIMNPPLRKAIISTTYLCLIGLTEGEKPNFSALVDQLYSLKTAAEAHKASPTNVTDSLVAELVTVTPILEQVQQRIESSGKGSSRAKSVVTALSGFRKAGGGGRPVHLIKRKIDKGKRVATTEGHGQGSHDQVHIHQMSLISQIQDLFPELRSRFIIQLLDEYGDNVEEVIAYLLENSLPSHLGNADRSEEWGSKCQTSNDSHVAIHPTSPQTPTRRNVYDGDEFDKLAIDTSKLNFGRRNPSRTADDVLQDRSKAPNKAAILSALAAFDSDDDERDDTYDVADVGGTVDSATPGHNVEEANAEIRDGRDEALFRAYKATPRVFDRDAATKRGMERAELRRATGMTDEAIEGWALMLSRDPRHMRRLETKFLTFSGGQTDLMATSWRASPAESGTEDSDIDGNNRGKGGLRGRGRRGGNVAGPASDKDIDAARHWKEANKGSRANHNRRDQRARKMAKGGLPG